MSDLRPACVVEEHEPHDRPRVYVLREPGRLWLFDLCQPHVWPGNHWGVPDYLGGSADGTVVRQGLTGAARSVAATGRSMHELRAALAAHVAYALVSERASPLVFVVRQPCFREIVRDVAASVSLEVPPEEADDDIRLQASSPAILERLITSLSDLEDVSVRIEGRASIEFPNEPERFYVLDDSPAIGVAVDEAALRLNLESVPNPETLAEHAPGLARRT